MDIIRLCIATNSGNRACPVTVMVPSTDNKKRHDEKWLISDPFSTHDKIIDLHYASSYKLSSMVLVEVMVLMCPYSCIS